MKINKKIVMPIMLVLGISCVMAIGYYALFSVSFNVLPSITLSDCEDDLGNISDGDTVNGSECTLKNNALSERHLVIKNNAMENISVSYFGTLTMAQKDAEWNVTLNGES